MPSVRVLGPMKPRNARSRPGLEVVLLHVGAPRDRPAGEEDEGVDDEQPPGRARIGPVSGRPQPHRVEIRVEGEAAPSRA